MASLTRGDDINFSVTLKKNNAVFAIDDDATIKAQFINAKSGLKMLTTPVDVLRITSGSDWDNSKIIIDVPAADSADLLPGRCLIEIQVNDTVNTEGKVTWFKKVTINADVIS